MTVHFEFPDGELHLNVLAGTESIYEERRHNLNAGYYIEQLLEDIYISCLHINSPKAIKNLEPAKPIVQLIFCLKGSMRSSAADGCCVRVPDKYHNLLFFPSSTQLVFEAGREIEIFEISLKPAFFSAYLPPEHTLFSISQKGTLQDSPCMVYENSMKMSAEMESVIHDILNCKWQGQARKVCAEAKIVELILLQFDQYRQTTQEGVHLRKADIDKMNHARDFMRQHPAQPCSLIELAHEIGTNEFTLKRDFKAVFGTTVFKYWHKLRMDYAKELLVKGKNVSETAYLSGYKHATHFTAAFKKHFGVMPKDMKA